MQWLFDHGAQEDVRTPDAGATPMWIASYNNNVEAMQWLFDHGAQEDVRTPNNNGVTPMCIASQKNNVEAMQWLFDHGARRSNTKERWCHTHVDCKSKQQRGSNAVVV